MAKLYQGSHQGYGVISQSNVMMATRDGVRLATDIYFPAIGGRIADGPFPVILERTPYNKAAPGNVTNGKYFARRGYICAIQDVRGRFESEGEWYAFAKEAPDGFEAVEWLGSHPRSNGRVGTMGASYSGSDQAALATLDPPHLSSMIIAVGASNYYHSSMRQNGALEQRFLIYVFRMAVTSREASADPALKAELMKLFSESMPHIVKSFPLREGTTILRRLPSYERWAIDILTHGDYDSYWNQRGYAMSEYYTEHADVPTLYLGGWYDSYARNTCESFVSLRKKKSSPQKLLMGPWTHGGWGVTYSGDLDFGTESHIDYNDTRLAWFDQYVKGLQTEAGDWSPVNIFTMGNGDGTRAVLGAPGATSEYPGRVNHGGYWRRGEDWPLPGTIFTPYYLHCDGTLSTNSPTNGASSASYFTFDPSCPVPTIGGGISAAEPVMYPGAFDQRGRPDFIGCSDTLPLAARHDVLTFQTEPLALDVEITGPIEMNLWASSSAVDTDFVAKLVDVFPTNDEYPDGLAFNISDSIIRARYRNGYKNPELMTPGKAYKFVFQLYPTSNIFRKGHRIRVDVSSSNWPRFDVNPNTGGPLGLDRMSESADQSVYHTREHSSHIVLPIAQAS